MVRESTEGIMMVWKWLRSLVAGGRFGSHFSRKLVIPLRDQKIESRLRGLDSVAI